MTFLPPDARADHLDLDGGRVRVLRSGPDRAPALLLVHGGSTDNAAISWYRMFGEFGPDHRVIAPDLPGFGGTEGIEPLGGPTAQADFLARVLTGLGVERAVVVGVSMGGDVAMNLALRHPALVRGLVLIAPGGLVERAGNRFTHRAAWRFARMPDALLFRAAALANRFGARLEFGTAGLRGALGAGPNRMNRVTVMRATAGVARWLGPGRTVVIGYDARHRSADQQRDVERGFETPGGSTTPRLRGLGDHGNIWNQGGVGYEGRHGFNLPGRVRTSDHGQSSR